MINPKRSAAVRNYHNDKWDEIAQYMGFKDEREMWQTLQPTIWTKELAAITGYCRCTIRYRIKRAGIKPRPRGGPHSRSRMPEKAMENGFKSEKEMYQHYRDKGYSYDRIALLFNCNGSHLARRARACGVEDGI